MLLCLLLAMLSPSISSGESESPAAGSVGFETLLLHPGWNLISFPHLDEDDTVASVFGVRLLPGESEQEADNVFGLDPQSGQWVSAWLDMNDIWRGELSDDTLTVDAAYWVHLRDDHEAPVELRLFGSARMDSTIARGLFSPGIHPVGSLYAASLTLDQTGLAQSGYTVSEALVPPTGDDVAPGLYGYAAREGFYRVALLTEAGWRGSLSSLDPGAGYLLVLAEELVWQGYRRPDLEPLAPGDLDPALPMNQRKPVAAPAGLTPPGFSTGERR